jgi:hypothetical protein
LALGANPFTWKFSRFTTAPVIDKLITKRIANHRYITPVIAKQLNISGTLHRWQRLSSAPLLTKQGDAYSATMGFATQFRHIYIVHIS